ncbi:septum formation family protein [Dactylosporangium sp. NBC_01737]|uniref:septum formation family protein n=1 Tax=Dactylosporangium sp. NBC_01737 TaxID=2975959 RepID=UPI002E1466EA|nr:septum formation family protein [Dactylosporangium sp. NBC_01737]
MLALVLLAAAGCTKVPAGVDKDLVDEWAMMAEAKVTEPKAGDCWTTQAGNVIELLRSPLAVVQTPCEFNHVAETVHVGHFTGTLADADRAPSLEDMADAYAACDAELTKFLGGSWQVGRVRMLVYPPSGNQWKGGARFFRCDVAALRSERGLLDPRTSTLKDALRAGSDMLLGCGSKVETGGAWTDVDPLACTAPHDVEFVGNVTSVSAVFPTDAKTRTAAWSTGCLNKIRSYTGMPDSALAKAKAAYGFWPLVIGQDEWKAGNHNARCYLSLPKKITRSLKGAGNIAI